MQPLIRVKNVRKIYRMGDERVVALDNISLEIYKGEIVCFLGTSGSGKSTFLNMVAGLEKPTRGSVLIKGNDIAKMNENKLARFRQEHVGFIFQSYNLMPSLTALENVSMPLMLDVYKRQSEEEAGRGQPSSAQVLTYRSQTLRRYRVSRLFQE